MYEIKSQEWDLTEDEQEKASFIMGFCKDEGESISLGKSMKPDIEKVPFEAFKTRFYIRVCRRILIRHSPHPQLSLEGDYDCFSISEDGKRLIGYRVEKVE